MLYLNYTKITNGLEIWIDFAANARSYLVTGAIPTNLTNISQILDYCKVPEYKIIIKPLLIYIGFMLILMIVTIFGVSFAPLNSGAISMFRTMLLQGENT